MSETIRIGFPVPLTSVYGVEAADQAKCGQIAVDEFNESGGLNGMKAELLVRDTQHNTQLTKSLAAELIDKEKIHFMVGALSAIDMMTLAKICAEKKMVYNGISVGDGIVSSEYRSPYVFHEGPTAFGTADSVGRYAYCHFGFRVAFLTVNSAFGPDTLRGLMQLGKDIGIEVVANELHTLGQTDFSESLERIEKAQPEVLVTTNFGGDQFNMLKQIQERGLGSKMRVVCTSIAVTQRIKGGAELYRDVVGGTGYYWKIEDEYDSAKTFNLKYKKLYGDPPASGHGIYGYCGVKAVLTAVQKAQSLDSLAVAYEMEGMRFDFCRGPQFYRRLDHQSVQPVVILESKAEAEMENAQDLFRVLDIVKFLGERSFHIVYEKR